MRRMGRGADDTGGHRLAAVEEFDVYPLWRHAQGGERLLHVSHEPRRPADVDIRVSWHTDRIEHRSRAVPGRLEILLHRLVRALPAVTHIAATVRQRQHEAADFGGKWMMLPIASAVEPPDRSCRGGRR